MACNLPIRERMTKGVPAWTNITMIILNFKVNLYDPAMPVIREGS